MNRTSRINKLNKYWPGKTHILIFFSLSQIKNIDTWLYYIYFLFFYIFDLILKLIYIIIFCWSHINNISIRWRSIVASSSYCLSFESNFFLCCCCYNTIIYRFQVNLCLYFIWRRRRRKYFFAIEFFSFPLLFYTLFY